MISRSRTPWYERVFWSVHSRSYDDFGGVDSPEVGVVVDLIAELAAGRSLDVLDIGAGTGNYSVSLAEAGNRVTAIDVAGGMLAQLRTKADERGVAVTTRRADVHQGIDAPTASYDLVLCSYILQVIREPALLLGEIQRVLRPDGRLVVVSADPTTATRPEVPVDAPFRNRLVWRVKQAVASRSPKVNPSRSYLVGLLDGQGFRVIRDQPDPRRIVLVAIG